MAIVVEATFEGGVFRPKQPVTIREGAEVHLEVTLDDEVYDPLAAVIGICDSGPDFSLAERHDELLYGMERQPDRTP